MDIASQSSAIRIIRQLIVAVLIVAALFLVANLARYERLDNKPCPFDQFCYAVFDRWHQNICYVLPQGVACSREEVSRLKFGLWTDVEAGLSSSYSSETISAIIGGGAIIALTALHFWTPKKREQESTASPDARQDIFDKEKISHDLLKLRLGLLRLRLNVATLPMSLYLSIRNLWIDEITNEDQARQIIRRASRYAFWYWFLSASSFNNQINKIKPHLRSIDPALLTSFEAMILSPAFVLGASTIFISALTCCYIMKKKNSRTAATLLLILWTFQAWLRATYLQPDIIWTPLFIFVIWTTARGLLATNKIAIFKKEP